MKHIRTKEGTTTLCGAQPTAQDLSKPQAQDAHDDTLRVDVCRSCIRVMYGGGNVPQSLSGPRTLAPDLAEDR